MLGTILLINLAGAVALLLWGTHMVSSGVLRGFGTVLRNWLGRHLGNRWLALLAGLGITGLLQSSTATSLMAASFTASGTLGLAPALAVMLGANVGTTLVVQLLSFDTSLLAPLALLSGLLLFRLGDGPRLESLGQCLIGLGLMLLALALLGHSLQQIEASPAFVAVIHGLEGDPLIALLLAALLTWACHSSVAVVLLVASLAQAGLVSLPIALALVLGANLGGALPALGVAGSRVARRLPLGNLLVRLLGCLLVRRSGSTVLSTWPWHCWRSASPAPLRRCSRACCRKRHSPTTRACRATSTKPGWRWPTSAWPTLLAKSCGWPTWPV